MICEKKNSNNKSDWVIWCAWNSRTLLKCANLFKAKAFVTRRLTQTKCREEEGDWEKSLSVEILAYNKNSLHFKLYDTCLQLL